MTNMSFVFMPSPALHQYIYWTLHRLVLINVDKINLIEPASMLSVLTLAEGSCRGPFSGSILVLELR